MIKETLDASQMPLEVAPERKVTGNIAVKAPQPIETPDKYFPMLHGKATDAIAGMSSKNGEKNPISGALTITNKEVKLLISQFNQLTGALGINTHKLLSVGVAQFTAGNNVGGRDTDHLTYNVTIPLKEYALQCGYDVEEHPKDTPEEQEKEAKRASNALKDAQKKVKKDLDILRNSSISWSEKVKGKAGDFLDIAIIGSKGIRKGYIYMVFDPAFAQYLIKLPLTQYPKALLKVDARNGNAYNMGLKMTEHFNMDNNQIKGTAQLLKVSTLLENLDLPSIETVRKTRKSWEERIKEPFENALDVLTQCGLLSDWRYSHSKGLEMTDEEATSFSTYEEWENTLVHFTLADAPDHTLRLEARAEEKKARQAKKKKPLKKKGVVTVEKGKLLSKT